MDGALAGLVLGLWLERTLFLPALVIGGPAGLLGSATASLAGSVLHLVREVHICHIPVLFILSYTCYHTHIPYI